MGSTITFSAANLIKAIYTPIEELEKEFPKCSTDCLDKNYRWRYLNSIMPQLTAFPVFTRTFFSDDDIMETVIAALLLLLENNKVKEGDVNAFIEIIPLHIFVRVMDSPKILLGKVSLRKIALHRLSVLDLTEISLFLKKTPRCYLEILSLILITHAVATDKEECFEFLLKNYTNGNYYTEVAAILIKNKAPLKYIHSFLSILVAKEIDMNDDFRRIASRGLITIKDLEHAAIFLKCLAKKENKTLQELFIINELPSLPLHNLTGIKCRKLVYQIFYTAGLSWDFFVELNKRNPMLSLTEWLSQEEV